MSEPLIEQFDFVECLTNLYHDISADRWPSAGTIDDVERRAENLGLPKSEIEILVSVLAHGSDDT